MTITLTAKNQITIPSKIAKALGLRKGALFTIGVHKNKIELIPVEIRKKEFSPEVYSKLEALTAKEKGKEKKITKSFIKNLKSVK
ncbi:MAG: AbrB/MazE/SpoVT family DNA-binding domain-containing protein [Candidatus Omnitrophota bacterium]